MQGTSTCVPFKLLEQTVEELPRGSEPPCVGLLPLMLQVERRRRWRRLIIQGKGGD